MMEKPDALDGPKDCPLCGKPAKRIAWPAYLNRPVYWTCPDDTKCHMSAISCSLEVWNNRPLEALVEEMLYRALTFINARGLTMPGQEACKAWLRRMGWSDA